MKLVAWSMEHVVPCCVLHVPYFNAKIIRIYGPVRSRDHDGKEYMDQILKVGKNVNINKQDHDAMVTVCF